jgi:hypothetical protein
MRLEKARLFVATLALAALCSCGYGSAAVLNNNNNTTQVQLSTNNFHFVQKVSGTSSMTYIFGIGGLSNTEMYHNAYTAMMDSADLKIGSRTVTNILTEEHVGGFFPFYFTRTLTVSGSVIEFTR